MSHRNEPARARRRQVTRETLSLRSIPLAEPPEHKYTLENHFGWQVLQKCRIGDGTFPPYLLHCGDKPDMAGRDDGDHEVYVLYVRGEDGKLEPVDVKETQTVFSTTNAAPAPKKTRARKSSPEEKEDVKRQPLPQHRRRVISDFYYIPIKQRVDAKYDVHPSTEVQSGDNKGDVGSKKKNKKPKAERGRAKPKSWQLRAGAESLDETSEEEEEECKEEDTISKFIENLKKDCANCFNKQSLELVDSPENKYLYLPRERYEKRAQHQESLDANNNYDCF